MRSFKLLPAMVALLASTAAFADDIKVGVGISGWT
ncbi:MAG: ABC transporter permease, partial [Bradyrhizobium sp.]